MLLISLVNQLIILILQTIFVIIFAEKAKISPKNISLILISD